ncbi:MAG: hypothetical protein WC619_04165 [Patescibacteria group bacterium]
MAKKAWGIFFAVLTLLFYVFLFWDGALTLQGEVILGVVSVCLAALFISVTFEFPAKVFKIFMAGKKVLFLFTFLVVAVAIFSVSGSDDLGILSRIASGAILGGLSAFFVGVLMIP